MERELELGSASARERGDGDGDRGMGDGVVGGRSLGGGGPTMTIDEFLAV